MILMTSGRARRQPMDARRTEWEQRPPSAALDDRGGQHDRYAVTLSTDGGDADQAPLLQRASEALLRYDIYPPNRMRRLVCSPDQRVRQDVVIVQRIFFGPVATEAAVRVVDLFGAREPDIVIGFSYVTLQGHAERGVATFTITRGPGGHLSFNIESWSRPASGVGELMAPLSRLLQKRFSHEALQHFRQ